MTGPRLAEVSVVIATRDRAAMLDRCLASLLAQVVLPREIVIVDQSAGADTAAVVRQHAAGPVALIHQPQATHGLAVAQNLGFASARAALIAVTDDDCVVDPQWVAVIAAAFARAGGLEGLTGRVLADGPEGPDAVAVSTRPSTTPVAFDRRALPWDIGSGNNFAVQRAWLECLGGNDPRLGPGAPGQGGVDMDLFYRLARAGARLRYEPSALVYHARVSRRSRLARRGPYGYGMGAACALWLREGDRNAWRVLAQWGLMRARRLAGGAAHGDGARVHEEALVLAGTLRGLAYGWRAGRRAADHRPDGRADRQPNAPHDPHVIR